MKRFARKSVAMKLILIITSYMVVTCSGFTVQTNESSIDMVKLLEEAGYPRPGDIPVLNRKIFRAQRVSIREHPYVASIRRRYVHYLMGTLLTKNMVITVAHPLVNVSPSELAVVVGESYSDRGTFLATVLLLILHQDFDPYTLAADIAMVRFFEDTNYRYAVKSIPLASSNGKLDGHLAFLTGWGRCDNTGSELCLDRSSKYFPDERIDPMLRSICFPLTKSTNCEGYNRHEITLPWGVLCTGPSREEDPTCPCLGVPGAPLVVNYRLMGLLSWGFGCGYEHDLPLIYTDIQKHGRWILHNIVIMGTLKQANLTQLFRATKAYLIAEWFINTRVKAPSIQLREDKSMEPLDIDNELARLQGTVYDVRDFISGGAFHNEKQNLLASLITVEKTMQLKLMQKTHNTIKTQAFLSSNTANINKKWFPNNISFVTNDDKDIK